MSAIVIVGAGQGGLQAAASLRQEGYKGDITLIGAEPGLPYQRPPLSKAFLKGGDADKLILRAQAFFEISRINYLPDTLVDKIDRDARQIHTHDRHFDYHHLILATGTSNLRPPIPGLENAIDLRTLEDARYLRASLDRPRRCAVIGGGFIGLEFAAVARALGHEVTIAEAAERLMARAVSSEMSKRFLGLHNGMETTIMLGQPVVEARSDGITLADKTQIDADLIILAAGVRPNTDLAQSAGLNVDNGIVVDAQLRTSDPDISALGDCANFPDPKSGHRVRLESVQAATDHARAIARRLVKGVSDPYAAIPWFWSDQADWKLQIVGLAGPQDTSIEVKDAIVRLNGGTVTAVETINDTKTHMRTRKLFGSRPSVSLKDFEQL